MLPIRNGTVWTSKMNKPDRDLQVGALLRLVGGFDIRNAHNAQVEIHFGIQRLLREFPSHNAAKRHYILERFDKFLVLVDQDGSNVLA